METTLSITPTEWVYTRFIDTLVVLNRHTLRRDVAFHRCRGMHIQCDMLERQCGAPWSLLLQERRARAR